MMTLDEVNQLGSRDDLEQLGRCCAGQRWVDKMLGRRPVASVEDICQQAQQVWQTLDEADYLQAFAAHPKIGDVDSLRAKYANTKALAAGEQSGAQHASDEALERLAAGNQAYVDKFGFIFIVFATGKSAEQMLALLEQRLRNSRVEEITNAAANQQQITDLRLRKLLGES